MYSAIEHDETIAWSDLPRETDSNPHAMQWNKQHRETTEERTATYP